MKGIIEPMCDPDKLDLRHLITRRTHELDNNKRIIYWKCREAQQRRERIIREVSK
jgi:hypothetical protein